MVKESKGRGIGNLLMRGTVLRANLPAPFTVP